MLSLFRNRKDRYLRKIKEIGREINIMEPSINVMQASRIKERALALRTIVQREREDQNKENNFIHNLNNNILIEGIALLREVSKRKLGERPYDEQVLAGLALFDRHIVEMRNGEGKTLAATIPLFLETLRGKGAHLATTNKYLAKRDAHWMGPIYHGLGLTVGVLQENTVLISDSTSNEFQLMEFDLDKKKQLYNCDIVYGTAEGFAFDYLRDGRVFNMEDICQINGLNFAIIDEVDCVLIDQARQPYTLTVTRISDSEKFSISMRIAEMLCKDEDYGLDKKRWRVQINEQGIKKIEKALNVQNVYDVELLKHEKY